MARAEIVRGSIGVALCVMSSCGSSGGAPGKPEAESPVEVETPAVPACGEQPADGALTAFEGRACPWALRGVDDGRLELVHATVTPGSFVGDPPPTCDAVPCTYRGVETQLGALLVVEVSDAASEVPAGVWLGVTDGDALRFVDLWEDAGDPVIDDGVALGPSHALAPFDCEGTIALFVVPRIPGAAAIPSPDPLRDREGAVGSDGAAVKRERCEPLSIALP